MLGLPRGIRTALGLASRDRVEGDDEASRWGRIRVRRFAGPAIYQRTLNHIRVVHMTDLHVGRVTPYAIQREAIDRVNAQEPDLVAITGDFVCHSQLYLDQLGDLLRLIKAPVIGVLGNHDYWSGADEVMATLTRAGVEVLRNQHTTITIRHQRLQVLGLDDAYTGHARRDKAVNGLRRDLPVLGLSHIAEEADGLWRHNVPLVLSGHTHAGQVTVARLHELAIGKLAGHKYVHGLYGTRNEPPPHPDRPYGAVYVGAGIGAAVLPLRLGERGKREVTVFELGQVPGAFDEHHEAQDAHPGRKPSRDKIRKRVAAVERKRLRRLKRTAP